ncbi:head completion/stabilization protein [Enterovibrio sp. Hal110]
MSFGGELPRQQSTFIPGQGWPYFDTKAFRETRRIPPVFDEKSIISALEIAVMAVQAQLPPLEGRRLSGAESTLYLRAVFARAHADLLPEFATQNRRDEARNAAEDLAEQGDRFRAQSNRDIALLLGRSENRVALI